MPDMQQYIIWIVRSCTVLSILIAGSFLQVTTAGHMSVIWELWMLHLKT